MMPDITKDQNELYELIETYKEKIGNSESGSIIINYSPQELDRIIKDENKQIIKYIKLDGFLGEDASGLNDIQRKYHESEIVNNKRYNILIIICVAFGLLFLAVGIVASFFDVGDTLLTTISGTVLNSVGVIIKALQTASDKSKQKYFEALEEQRQRESILKLIRDMKEGTPKNKMIEKVIDGFYEKKSK